MLIRLLTLNIHKGFTSFNRRFVLRELREAIRSVGADIVFLQEVVGGHQSQEPGWPLQPHYEFLAESIWGYSAYGRNAVYTQGHHGNAVLSKFPILGFHNHDVSAGNVEKRGLLHCILDLPGRIPGIHVICTHLGLREWQRRRQLDGLCELVSSHIPDRAPLFIGGDFNDWRQRAHTVLTRCAGLQEAFVTRQGSAARSFPARRPILRLDRLYYRNASVGECRVLSQQPWSHLSDHAALQAEMEL
jgi:endonuclease/exonuclease/phosphatase family metal-dependent hydrolase